MMSTEKEESVLLTRTKTIMKTTIAATNGSLTKLITSKTECNGITTLPSITAAGGTKRSHSSLEQEADEEDEGARDEEVEEQQCTKPSASKLQKRETCYAAYRRIQHTASNKVTAEKGLVHDHRQELHYILTTIFDEKAATNLKSLGLTQLVKKSVTSEFRDFLRTQPNHLNRLFSILNELISSSPVISLSAACLLYFMARDRKGLPVTSHCVLLISGLLKQDQQQQNITKSAAANEEYAKHLAMIWSTIQEWLRYWQAKKTVKEVKFDIARDSLSCSYLTLEALAFVALKDHGRLFKAELLNSGCLTSVVAKLDKVVLELVHSARPKETQSSRLKMVERCYRVLENAAAFDSKNQTFLVQHRNSLLIFSSAKFLNFSLKFIEEANQEGAQQLQQQQSSQQTCPASTRDEECVKVFDNICLLCRVLMNVSHENENAALKIGQVAGFLGNCLRVLAHHATFAPKERFFDIAVMMYGLLVNLLEKCAGNRRKFMQLKTDFVREEGKVTKELGSLEILTKLFLRHDLAAKTVDEQFDNDLAAEEREEEGNGRDKAAVNMSQDEVLAAIQSMMSKASIHMEDSMIASYCSLVVAILVGSDLKLADQVRQLMPGNDLGPMLEQLERFLDFMRITKLKADTVGNIERVLNSFQFAASSSGATTS